AVAGDIDAGRCLVKRKSYALDVVMGQASLTQVVRGLAPEHAVGIVVMYGARAVAGGHEQSRTADSEVETHGAFTVCVGGDEDSWSERVVAVGATGTDLSYRLFAGLHADADAGGPHVQSVQGVVEGRGRHIRGVTTQVLGQV